MTGVVIVTGNVRLSRFLRRQFDLERKTRGDRVWEAADVLPLDAWLARCWEAVAYRDPLDVPLLLEAFQERILWEQAIASSDLSGQLLNLPETASAAAAAWDLLHAWEAPRQRNVFEGSRDSEEFWVWMQAVERKLDSNGWITASQLPAAVAARIENGRFPVPTSLSYAGFEELTPAQNRLFSALRRAGCAVAEFPLPAVPGSPKRIQAACADTAHELTSAAAWARKKLEENPEARLGVVVRGLAEITALAERAFASQLHPGLSFATGNPSAFHVSAGVPSSRVPLIGTALDALELVGGIPASHAAMLFRSPFLEIGFVEGSKLDLLLRKAGLTEVSIRNERVREALPNLAEAADQFSPMQRPSQWSALLSRWLTAASWPGTRTFPASEYQALEHWQKLLSSFARLDLVLPRISYRDALEQLKSLAAQSRFAPANERAPNQVMDMLEASGSRFDALWIAGLHAGSWPSPARPNPFLPLALQRASGMPRSSPERELAYARRMTGFLFDAAPEVVCSYPQFLLEEKLRPSPLLAGLPRAEALDEGISVARIVFSRRIPLEVEPLGLAPPLEPGARQSGGMRVIEDQAACPFRAFAVHRLKIREFDETSLGLSPLEKGSLVHKVMEHLWEKLQSQDGLRATSPHERQELIRESVSLAMSRIGPRASESFRSPSFQQIELQRLARLIPQWLDQELERPKFEVLQMEAAATVEVGPLQLTVRADRIDVGPDGRRIIIDYKTAKEISKGDWEGERPDQPQLPLYAVTSSPPPAEVAFAKFVSGDMRLIESGDIDHLLPKWKRVLENLAASFQQGHAEIDPKTPKQTCQYCHAGPLCRIAELNRAYLENSGEGGDE